MTVRFPGLMILLHSPRYADGMRLKRRCHFVVGFAHASQVVHPLNVHRFGARASFVCPAHHDLQSPPLRAFATFPECRRVGAIVVAAFLGFECFLGVIGRAVVAERSALRGRRRSSSAMSPVLCAVSPWHRFPEL